MDNVVGYDDFGFTEVDWERTGAFDIVSVGLHWQATAFEYGLLLTLE